MEFNGDTSSISIVFLLGWGLIMEVY